MIYSDRECQKDTYSYDVYTNIIIRILLFDCYFLHCVLLQDFKSLLRKGCTSEIIVIQLLLLSSNIQWIIINVIKIKLMIHVLCSLMKPHQSIQYILKITKKLQIFDRFLISVFKKLRWNCCSYLPHCRRFNKPKNNIALYYIIIFYIREIQAILEFSQYIQVWFWCSHIFLNRKWVSLVCIAGNLWISEASLSQHE